MRGMGIRLVVIGLAVSAVLGVPVTPGVAAGVCAPRTVGISDVNTSEGAGTMFFTVSSSGCAAGTLEYQAVSGAAGYLAATAGVDFLPASGQIGWTHGEVGSKTITVFILNDATYEPDEGLTVSLQAISGLSVADGSGQGVIVDDEAPGLSLTSEPHCPSEACLCRLRVALDRPVPVDVSVQLATKEGTAESGTDFLGIKTQVIIAAGATQALITVPILNDIEPEPTEYFHASISQASVGHIAAGTVTVFILDDDGPVSAAPGGRLP